MVILITGACLLSALYCILMSGITFANFLYQFANYLYICGMGLVAAFCCLNIKLKSKLAKFSLAIIGAASVLLGINAVQYMTGYGYGMDTDNFYLYLLIQYNIIKVIFFLGIALFLFSLKKVILLSGRQKVFRALGIIWILLYPLWICFFSFPNDALLSFSYGPEGILGAYAQACYNLYRPFVRMLGSHQNLNVISLSSDVILAITSIMFLKTKARSNEEGRIL